MLLDREIFPSFKMQEKERLYDVIFVGATLDSLNVLNRLPYSTLQNSIVLDRNGSWLATFRAWVDNLSIEFIRSPLNVHPSPKPLALKYYVDKYNRSGELLEMRSSAPLPSSKLFLDFCDSLIQKLPSNVQGIEQDVVVDIRRVRKDSNTAIEVCLASGRTLLGKSMVLGVSNVSPIVPKWVFRYNLDAHPRIRNVKDLDLRLGAPNDLCDRKTIAIFGGGMSAGTVALRALDLGAEHVYLISRRHLCKELYDCNPGWSGMKYLNAFKELDDSTSRLIMCNKARDRGSVLAYIWDRLVKMQAEGKLDVTEGVEVEKCNFNEQIRLDLIKNLQIRKNDFCSLDDQLCNTPFSKDVAVLLSRISPNQSNEMAKKSLNFVSCDEVWIACGNAFDVNKHCLLSKLMSKYPTESVGGYPVLNSDCSWPGLAVYIPGRGSMLTTGPCAPNMVGMKMSADLISLSIQKKLSESDENVSATSGQHATDFKFDPVNRVEVWSTGYEERDKTSLEEKHVPLESENLINSYYKEDKQRNLKKKSDNIMSFDQGIKKVEIQSFAFIDDGFRVSVLLTLPETIPPQSVRIRVTRTSFETWLVGKKAAYHLHVSKLYGKVVPERTKVVVKEDKNRVVAILHKEKDVEWKFLKG